MVDQNVPPVDDGIQQQKLDAEPRTVTMVRTETGYGFTITAGPRPYAGLVHGGSAAEKAGLRAGDEFLEVNGNNVRDASHDQVVELIKQGGENLTLLVAAKRNMETNSLMDVLLSLAYLGGPRVGELEGERSELAAKMQKEQEDELQKLKKARKALEREVSELGSQREQRNRKIVIVESSPRQHSQLYRIVSVVCLLTIEAYLLFTAAASALEHSASLQIPQGYNPRPHVVKITVPDVDTVFGFSVQGHELMKGQQFVSIITPDSAAERAGLRKGDRFLMINGIDVHAANLDTVMNLIDEYPTTVNMLVVSTSEEHVEKMMAGAVLDPSLEESFRYEQAAYCRQSLKCSIMPWIVVVLYGLCTLGIGAAIVFPRYPNIMMFPFVIRLSYEISVSMVFIGDFIGKRATEAPAYELLHWLKVFTGNFPAQLKEMLCYTDNRWSAEEMQSRLVTASLVAVFFVCLQKIMQFCLMKSCLRFCIARHQKKVADSLYFTKSSEPDDCDDVDPCVDCVVGKEKAAQQHTSIDMPDE